MPGTLSARRRVLAVLCGGFLGTLTRYVLSLAIQSWFGKAWPYDILSINLTGALLLALVSKLADATFLVGPTRRLLLTTGFLGAYTTFSSLALGEILLFSKGAWIPALLYVLLSLCGGLCAVLAGDWLGQALIARRRRTSGRLRTLSAQPEPVGHLNVQDDLLRADRDDELKSRIP